jgi:hypothetical protein
MDSPFIIPLAAFALVALIVAITQMARIRDVETQVAQRLYLEQVEHQKKMQELNLELSRVTECSDR